MKADTILKEVIKQIKDTTGYPKVDSTDDFASVNYDYGDVCILTNFLCKSLQLGEDLPGDIIHEVDALEAAGDFVEDMTIDEYATIVYNLIHG